MESPKIEANRIIKEFEKMAKDASTGPSITTKTSRLIEKFEKKSQGVDEPKAGNGATISSIKKVFEPDTGTEADMEKASDVISAGATNRLIGRFQETTTPTTDC